jgi:hypothetical protein
VFNSLAKLTIPKSQKEEKERRKETGSIFLEEEMKPVLPSHFPHSICPFLGHFMTFMGAKNAAIRAFKK